jgi:four helix bundle protein
MLLELPMSDGPHQRLPGNFSAAFRHAACSTNGMAKTFREMVAWQLAFELNRNVQRLLKTGPAARDFKFRDQLSDSSRGAPRTIAEGFGRFNPTETAQFLDFAIASLDETENHLREGVESLYFRAEDVAPQIMLIARCRKALTSWHAYLRRVKNNSKFNQSRRRRS